MVKNLPASEGDTRNLGSISGMERSPGVGNDNPLQYSCLEIPWTDESGGLHTAHGVAESAVTDGLSTHTHTHTHTHTQSQEQ